MTEPGEEKPRVQHCQIRYPHTRARVCITGEVLVEWFRNHIIYIIYTPNLGLLITVFDRKRAQGLRELSRWKNPPSTC